MFIQCKKDSENNDLIEIKIKTFTILDELCPSS